MVGYRNVWLVAWLVGAAVPATAVEPFRWLPQPAAPAAWTAATPAAPRVVVVDPVSPPAALTPGHTMHPGDDASGAPAFTVRPDRVPAYPWGWFGAQPAPYATTHVRYNGWAKDWTWGK